MRLLDALGGSDFHLVYDNGDEVEATVCGFACEIVGGALYCDGVETVEARWAEPARVPSLLTLPYPASLFLS